MKKNKSTNKGITLIALVITIIVLLILAGVSIAMLTGENGILTQADTAKTETEKKGALEEVQIEAGGSFDENGYNKDIAIENLKNNLGISAEKIKDNGDGTLTVEYKGYKFNVDTKGKVTLITDENQNQNPSVTPGTPVTPPVIDIPLQPQPATNIDVEDYGKKVNYMAKTDMTLTWRIFYDDDNYVYLISSKADGSNTVSSMGSTTNSPEITDSLLKSLNKQWFDLSWEWNNASLNAFTTAKLMDQSIWEGYKDAQGNASYAIGGPTIEMFRDSFNATAASNGTNDRITTSCTNIMGYSNNNESIVLSTEYNNGIYCNGSNWFLASPSAWNCGGGSYGMQLCAINNNSLGPDYVYYDSTMGVTPRTYGFRPVVAIPKARFTYTIMQ